MDNSDYNKLQDAISKVYDWSKTSQLTLASDKCEYCHNCQIQNCLARTVVKAPKSSHITPILRSLHWLKVNERIEYKLLSLTYKVLTTSQPDYRQNLISVQSTDRTRSSSLVTLARPSVSSSLQNTNRSFTCASPHLLNQPPSSFRQPHSDHCPPGSPHPAHITSSQSPPSLPSPVTPSTFHSRLKTHLCTNSFLHSHSYSFRSDFMDLNLY